MIQTISTCDCERTIFYQIYVAESLAIVQQTRKHRPAKPSPVNDLSAPRPTQADEDEWETVNHMMLTHHICDIMQLFRIERKLSGEQSDVNEKFPDCRRTDVADRLNLDQSARKILFSYDCTKIKKAHFGILPSEKIFGIPNPLQHLTKQKQPKPIHRR